MTYVKCMKRVPENGLPCQLQAGHKHRHSAEPAERPEQTTLMELDDLMWDSKPSSYNAMPDATHNRQILEAFHRGQVTACNNYEALKQRGIMHLTQKE